MNAALCCGTNTGLPCQPRWLQPCPDGLGVSHQGPRLQRAPGGPHAPAMLSVSSPARAGFPDCLSFTAVGFLGAPRPSGRLSSYRQSGADRVGAVILESWTRRRGEKMCAVFVCAREGDSEFPVHITALLRIPVLSQHQT